MLSSLADFLLTTVLFEASSSLEDFLKLLIAEPKSAPTFLSFFVPNKTTTIINISNIGGNFAYKIKVQEGAIIYFRYYSVSSGSLLAVDKQDENNNIQVIFELEGAAALETMPDMNLRMNAIIECESFIVEAGKNPKVIESLMRYLFEVLIMPSQTGDDIGDKPVEAAPPEDTSPQNPNEGSENIQNSEDLNWWDSELVNSQLELSTTEVCNEYGCITVKTKADKWPDGLIEAVELNDYPFLISTQWHPEMLKQDSIFEGLIRASME